MSSPNNYKKEITNQSMYEEINSNELSQKDLNSGVNLENNPPIGSSVG